MGSNGSRVSQQDPAQFNFTLLLSDPDAVNESEITCGYESVDFDRFMLIVACGTPFAVLGIIFNIITLLIYIRSHHLRTCDLYFAILAFLDTAFCILYIFLMTIDAISLHNGFTSLYAFYMTYTFPMFAVGRIIQLASVYMVVAATVERFFLIRRWSDTLAATESQFLQAHRRLTVVLSLCAGCVCLRAPSFWEYSVEKNPACRDPFGAYQFEPRLAAVQSYILFNLYVMNFVQVFAPFVLLTVLNYSIIRTLRRRLSLAKEFLFPLRCVTDVRFEKGVSREKLKSATYTLVALVTGYLVSNLFNIVITILEHTAKERVLLDDNGQSYQWYTLSSDISSLLTIVNSCSRLPLYCLCSRAFRAEVWALFQCMCKRREHQEIMKHFR